MARPLILVVCLAIVAAACGGGGDTTTTVAPTTASPVLTTTTAPPDDLALTSPSFDEGGAIPVEFTCDGPDVNPQLNLTGLPSETVTLAIIVDDPDAPVGVWDHWVEYDISAGPGDFTIEQATPNIGIEGTNSWNVTGYGGPCPPEGERHRYFFTVYVLSEVLDLPSGLTADELRAAMEGAIVDEAVLTGTYER